MISNISNYASYEMLIRTSMNTIKQTPGFDQSSQNLFSMSLTAMYGNTINNDVIKDVNKFVDAFESTNKSLLDAYDDLDKTLAEPISHPVESPPNTSIVQNDVDLNIVSTNNEENQDNTRVAIEASDDNDETDNLTTTEDEPKTSRQTQAAQSFLEKLNDTVNFLDDNNKSKNTDLLRKRIQYDFSKQEDALSEIGISQDSSGSFEISTEDFEAALAKDPQGVTELLTGDDGFATAINDRISSADQNPSTSFALDGYDLRNLGANTEADPNQESYDTLGQDLTLLAASQKGGLLNMLI